MIEEQETGPLARADALRDRAIEYVEIGAEDAARMAFDDARRIYRTESADRALGLAHTRLAEAYANAASWDAVREHSLHAIALLDRLDAARAGMTLARAHLDGSGDVAAAQAALEPARDAGEPGVDRLLARCSPNPAKARAHLERGLALAQDLGRADETARSSIALARMHRERGRADVALALLERADDGRNAELMTERSRVHEALGDPRRALHCERLAEEIESSRFARESKRRLAGLQALHGLAREELAAALARERTQRELRLLPRRLLTAQDEERARIGSEFQDDVIPQLASITLDLGELQDARAEPIRERLALISRDLIQLNSQIHPTILRDLGATESLRVLAQEFARETGCELDLAIDGSIEQQFALVVYRVAQEALRNIAKHAGARRVGIRLGRTQLRIEDDGKGFDPRVAGRGVGLASMDERMRACGGRLEIRSTRGSGTTVTAEFAG